jgi:hypothetical protein
MLRCNIDTYSLAIHGKLSSDILRCNIRIHRKSWKLRRYLHKILFLYINLIQGNF